MCVPSCQRFCHVQYISMLRCEKEEEKKVAGRAARAENVTEGIACFRRALRVYTADRNPKVRIHQYITGCPVPLEGSECRASKSADTRPRPDDTGVDLALRAARRRLPRAAVRFFPPPPLTRRRPYSTALPTQPPYTSHTPGVRSRREFCQRLISL
jgi:hypothetical protein